jgi:hypothetical protein
MINEPATMLLRIRTETLRVNLKRAHANLKKLPDLVKQFAEVQQRMDELRGETWKVGDILDKLRREAGRANLSHYKDLAEASNKIEDVSVEWNKAHERLKSLREKSFLVAVGPVGSAIGACLDERAEDLQQQVAALEKIPPGAEAWNALGKIEADARNRVFDESVEVLGGIALRDARLDADICELAEALIGSISARGQNLNVIPGGMSTMMMTIEQIVRLRFPEWTVWALPFVVSEVWALAARKDLEKAFGRSPEVAKLAADPIVQRCIGDAFATYVMGPAYAFAALTLSFDPANVEDELRTHAVLKMLHLLDRSSPDGFHESYHTLAEELSAAWNSAKQQAGERTETPAAALDDLLDALGRLASRLDASEAADLRARANKLAMLISSKPNLPTIDAIDTVVQTLFDGLHKLVYFRFEPSQWGTVKSWAEKLVAGKVDKIEFSKQHNMRHALNAAWLARVSDRRTNDISEAANILVDRLRSNTDASATGVSGGPSRSLK